jgi:hypothetical protein
MNNSKVGKEKLIEELCKKKWLEIPKMIEKLLGEKGGAAITNFTEEVIKEAFEAGKAQAKQEALETVEELMTQKFTKSEVVTAVLKTLIKSLNRL